MNYELALELKKAGFPLPAHTDCDFESGGCCRCGDDDKEVCIPTLSELIEACGDRDGIVIWRFSGKWYAGQAEHWSGHQIYGEIDRQTGSTPEEAVAQLLLELNK